MLMQTQKENKCVAVYKRFVRRIAKSVENQSVSQGCVLW